MPQPDTAVAGLDHVNIRTTPAGLERLSRFYVDVLGLVPGPRAAAPNAGAWLYAGGHPIVHLSASAASESGARAEGRAGFDHVAFRGVDADALLRRLAQHGVPYREARVDGRVRQVFLTDPEGTKLEVNFASAA